MKKIIAVALILMALLNMVGCSASNAGAPGETSNEDWPGDKLTVIVPWKSGGGADSSARLFAKYWAEELGTNIIIENREGGDAVVGSSYYRGLKQDGNTILMMAMPFYSAMILSGNVDFTMDDFSTIGIYENDPSCLAVMPSSGYGTFDELDAAIKANPGQIRIGVNGGSTHLIMMNLLIDKCGWDVKVVYYDGASESRTALMGGHVDVIATTLAGCTEEIPLIIGSQERNAAFADCPTYLEKFGELDVFGTTRMFLIDKSVEENYPERYQKLVETFKETFDNAGFQEAVKNAGRGNITMFHDVEESNELLKTQNQLAEDYWDILSGN